jgi:hypothetical protein
MLQAAVNLTIPEFLPDTTEDVSVDKKAEAAKPRQFLWPITSACDIVTRARQDPQRKRAAR